MAGLGMGGAARGECGGVLLAASVEGCCSRRVWRGAARGECGGVLLAASVGRTLSPPARVVVLLMSDFLAYFC